MAFFIVKVTILLFEKNLAFNIAFLETFDFLKYLSQVSYYVVSYIYTAASFV